MKKLLFILALVFSSSVYAQQIKNFDELMNALKAGKQVSMVVYYGKCKLISDNEEKSKSPDAVGGMALETWEYFAPKSIKNENAFVTFSETKLIQDPHGDGFVYNYVKVKVSDDQKVKITARYLNPKTFEIQMDENFFSEINDGKNEKAVYFYIQ